MLAGPSRASEHAVDGGNAGLGCEFARAAGAPGLWLALAVDVIGKRCAPQRERGRGRAVAQAVLVAAHAAGQAFTQADARTAEGRRKLPAGLRRGIRLRHPFPLRGARTAPEPAPTP